MYNTAVLLQNGADAMDKDVARAVSLYERAMDDGGNYDGMYNLAVLLQYGAD